MTTRKAILLDGMDEITAGAWVDAINEAQIFNGKPEGATLIELTVIGWCPRNGGHLCGPDPIYGPDDGSCGSKYTHTAMMTQWEAVDE